MVKNNLTRYTEDMEISSVSLSGTRAVRSMTPTSLHAAAPLSIENMKKAAWVDQLLRMPDLRNLSQKEVSVDPKEIAAKLLVAEPFFQS